MSNAQYLGDGVYAHVREGGDVVLTTGHHDPSQADNTIVMEGEVIQSFQKWLEKVKNAT